MSALNSALLLKTFEACVIAAFASFVAIIARPITVPRIANFILPICSLILIQIGFAINYSVSSNSIAKEVVLNKAIKNSTNSSVYADVISPANQKSHTLIKYIDEDGYEKKLELDENTKIRHKDLSKNKLSYTKKVYYNIFGKKTTSKITTVTIYEKTSE